MIAAHEVPAACVRLRCGRRRAIRLRDDEDIRDLRSIDRGPCTTDDSTTWNDCISSVRVAPATRVTLYRDPNFRGESLELTGDVANLQLEKGTCPHEGLNDCVTAIRFGNP